MRSNTGQLARLRDTIPAKHHKTLYHSLFESHLSYGITVWGHVSGALLKPLKVLQKHCIRVMFGDKQAYLDKFCTALRTRAPECHALGSQFFCKEPSKPLFNKHKLFVIENLYSFHLLMDLYKILKEHSPLSLYNNCFTVSVRKSTLLLVPPHHFSYAHSASTKWNLLRTCETGVSIADFSASVPSVKKKLRLHINIRQNIGDSSVWSDDNFSLV